MSCSGALLGLMYIGRVERACEVRKACPPNAYESRAGENPKFLFFSQEINSCPQNPQRFTVIIFTADFQRMAKLSAGECRGRRNCKVSL